MRIVADPRCPVHAAYEPAYALRPDNPYVPIWMCSVCRRPLGAACAPRTDESEAMHRFPLRLWPRRRPRSPREMQLRAVDWTWFMARMAHSGRLPREDGEDACVHV